MSDETRRDLAEEQARKRDLIDPGTQKAIVQHNWLKDHEVVSPYGVHYRIAGLMGGGLSESYAAAYKLLPNGEPERDSWSGRPKPLPLALGPGSWVIEYLAKQGIESPKQKMVRAAKSLQADMEEGLLEEVETGAGRLLDAIEGRVPLKRGRNKGKDALMVEEAEID